MKGIERFKEEYTRAMQKKGLRVEYFGSTKDSKRWRKGESDLDIFVYGDNIPSNVKVEEVLLIKNLNYQFDLGLENVPFQHWTPIYIDSPGRRTLKALSEEGIIEDFTKNLRKVVKDMIRTGSWPITYSGNVGAF